MIPTCAVSMSKLCAMSDSSPTGTNSVVLKIKAATASVTTRSHATFRETVFVVIKMFSQVMEKGEGVILRLLLAKIQTICDADLILWRDGKYPLHRDLIAFKNREQ
ncbi:Hypothetical protein AKI40_2998 [Enterobacter sp. FY-07]|nr:Hypothetical protein AKI40_2998 [Enterobacter sp. FY-07]